jgi:hypothetical protein
LRSVRRDFVALRSALDKSTFDLSVVVIERNIVEPKLHYSEAKITCMEMSRNHVFCSFSRPRKFWVAFLCFEKGMVARVRDGVYLGMYSLCMEEVRIILNIYFFVGPKINLYIWNHFKITS